MERTAQKSHRESGTQLFGFNCTEFGIIFIRGHRPRYLGELDSFIPPQQIEYRFVAQLGLSVLCTAWFWVRMRHYTYRKPFWFELKEIVKTLFVFSLLDLALITIFQMGLLAHGVGV